MKPIVFLLFFLISFPLLASNLPAGFFETRLAAGLDPVSMAIAPDGRLFIAEKNGRILILRGDSLLPNPFLEIAVDNFNERGLGGIVLDPQFDLNGYVYVYYTVPNGHFNRISRFQANGDLAIPGSETILLDLDPLGGAIHNGGAMQFGPDGMLYIAVGDGAYGAYAGDLDKIYGKILRIHPDGSIPEDNPFFTQTTGKFRAIYARGLRNPFTLTVDPVTGQMLTNDVGRETWEEVNEITAGAHYGWQNIEGKRTNQVAPPGYQDPKYAYSHVAGCAVIGGAFYRPQTPQFPAEYEGKYFFGDYCNGSIRVLNPATGQLVRVFATGINRLVFLLTAPDGSLYYLARGGLGDGSEIDNTSSTDGALWKVTYTGSGAPKFSVQPQSVVVPAGEDASFQVAASGAEPLHYQWIVNGALLTDSAGTDLVLPAVQLAQNGSQVVCYVRNAFGADTSLSATLEVTPNQRPAPVILWPPEGATYSGGDTLRFRGQATDPEEGVIAPESLTWRVDFFHDTHSHPGMLPLSGVTEGEFIIPRIGELATNVWYRVVLTATDSAGFSRSAYRDVRPRLSTFRIESEPSGLAVNVDGLNVVTPWKGEGVAGMQRTFLTPAGWDEANGRMVFRHWENGGVDMRREVILPEGEVRYQPVYARLLYANGTGIRGAYHKQQAWGNWDFSFRPAFSRIDETIDFDWGEGSPDPRLPSNDFLVRWEGYLVPYETDRITFTTLTDDGVRLWVNDSLLIDEWDGQQATAYRGSITLNGGVKYPIRMEYFEAIGGATARLYWSGSRFDQEIVPRSQLFPALKETPPVWYIGEVYPVPAADHIAVWMYSPEPETLSWQLLGTTGRLADERVMEIPAGESLHFFDLTYISRGLYIARATDSRGRTQYRKVVKQ